MAAITLTATQRRELSRCTAPISSVQSTSRASRARAARAHAAGAFIFKDDNPARHQTRPHRCAATGACGDDDRCDHDRHSLAATFGARISRWCCPQEARSLNDEPSAPWANTMLGLVCLDIARSLGG